MDNSIDIMALNFKEQFELFMKIKDKKARFALQEWLSDELIEINLKLNDYYDKLEIQKKTQEKQ